MRRPTIYDLAALNAEAGEKYFSAGTLEFFKQRITDFEVFETDEPGVYRVRAAKRGKWLGDVVIDMVSETWISGRTGKSCHPLDEAFLEEHRAAPVGAFG